MEETLFDELFYEVNSCLKHSTNGLVSVTDIDSKRRTELALEITTAVLELVEKRAYPPKAIATPTPDVVVDRYFRSLDGRLWSTTGNSIVRYAFLNDKLVGHAETEIYETVQNLADCDDVVEIEYSEFQKLLKNLSAPF